MAESDERKAEQGGMAGRGEKPEEAELPRKLHERTDFSQERGERIATGKAIATGGESTQRPPSSRPDEGSD